MSAIRKVIREGLPGIMINNSPVNRRVFMQKALTWGKRIALLSLFPACVSQRNAIAFDEKKQILARAEHLSLRELSESKLNHYDGRFLNPFHPEAHGGPWRLLQWKLFSKNYFKSFYREEPVQPVNIDWQPVREHHGFSVTFVRHACVMIKDQHEYILVDPVFHNLFWYEDFSPLQFDLEDLPSPHHILITHGHYDHLDTRSLSHMKKTTHVITPLGYNDLFEDLAMSNRTQLDWFDAHRDGKREIILLPCSHWTMRNPFVGPNDSLWGSFLLKSASGPTILIAGDLAFFDRFKELGEEFSIDLAIFNLGAYEPRWFMASSHINPAETVKAFIELKARHLLVVHWGTFRLGDEPVHFPPLDIKREMEKQGILDHLIHLDHGQTLFYGKGEMDIV